VATFNCTTSAQFTTAIASASGGDEIILQAGTTYTGNFILPNHGGSSYVTIKSSATLPRRRIHPSDASLLPKITSTTGYPLRTADTAAYWRLEGLEFHPGSRWSGQAMVDLGTSNAANVAHHMIVDRCYIHGDSTLGSLRGLTANVKYFAAINNYIADFKLGGSDSQAFLAYNCEGYQIIENNFLQAASESLLYGGAASVMSTGGFPRYLLIRGNHFYKPPSWQGVVSTKNHLELKCGEYVLITGNVFENQWASSQEMMIVIKVGGANDTGTTNLQHTRYVTVRDNIFRNSTSGVWSISNSSSAGGNAILSDITFDNNLFENTGARNLILTTNPNNHSASCIYE
jgi:hypothetical protein